MHNVSWEVEYDNGVRLRQFEGAVEHRRKDIDEKRVSVVRVFVDGKTVVEFEKLPNCELIGPRVIVQGRIGVIGQKRTLSIGQHGNDYNVEYQISENTGRVMVV